MVYQYRQYEIGVDLAPFAPQMYCTDNMLALTDV
jgi:hypothetical protein